MPRQNYDSIQKQIKALQLKAKKLEAESLIQKQKAVTKVKALMKQLKVEVNDLTETAQKNKTTEKSAIHPKSAVNRTKTKVSPKYRNPETGETWTGRGKAPRWLATFIQEGVSRERFLI
ncbi:MAG: H-NS histone family protein, partial [Betaproteobacteria bacterium]|nr:H-NS histone family protein [Betaproteobacteria bacterium]